MMTHRVEAQASCTGRSPWGLSDEHLSVPFAAPVQQLTRAMTASALLREFVSLTSVRFEACLREPELHGVWDLQTEVTQAPPLGLSSDCGRV
mmetsp:Transcript_84525/g.273756  ORF Transcript_84525/g.273756 Transcript_84525/m.273756 type:complete len:92 (+) Transcript_84525:1905-2180(+)